ncbi:MAG TPA: hypothetical protein PLQ11_06535 [Beijerinckiaceae bacterium]|nr:hypothetical protein [Beijerinckiaceae bacterium]
MSSHRPMLRMMFTNWALGIALGLGFAALMLAFDIGGLWSLIQRSDSGWIAAALLAGGFSVTCGGVVCASAIMRMPREEDDPTPGLPELAEPALAQARRR